MKFKPSILKSSRLYLFSLLTLTCCYFSYFHIFSRVIDTKRLINQKNNIVLIFLSLMVMTK
ncbi:hypothetical protein C1646_731245 [Rhizophagus diaphanus]|nr:hypothetical protein C1646_731245 [Rhizophagus diaphanus] [Rhizophagus sp. MUCL 43196]